MQELTVATRLILEARQFNRGIKTSGNSVTDFTHKAKKELRELRGMFAGINGKLAGVGVTLGGTAVLVQSARLDKSLIRIGQTAGENTQKVKAMRRAFFEMTRDTGQGLNGLKGGFDDLIQAGLKWGQASATISAINPASAVTGASPLVLSGGLTVAAAAFDFDLSQPGLAVELLDKMVVAGRLGNAELEDLSGIFARVGPNAKRANLEFTETLGFIEELSMIERNPQRLATLAESTLRLFTNETYKRTAQRTLGGEFYNADDSSRPAFDVLKDIRDLYQSLGTDRQRASLIEAAFGKADLDTKKGLGLLFTGDALDNADAKIAIIEDASGTIARDLPDAINNAVDQTGRLKAVLRDAADGFAQPVNAAVSGVIKFLLNKEDGLGLSGNQIIGGGAAAVTAAVLGAKYGGPALKKLGGRFLGIAGGVATGKALEEAAGVTPVYVVNMPGAGMGFGGNDGKRNRAGGRNGKGLKRAFNLPNELTHQSFLTKESVARGAGYLGAAAVVNEMVGSFYENRIKDRAIEHQAIADWNGLLEKLGLAANKMDAAADKMGEAKARVQVDINPDGAVNAKMTSEGEALELLVSNKVVVN